MFCADSLWVDFFLVFFFFVLVFSMFKMNLMKSILLLELMFCFLVYISQSGAQSFFFLIILLVLGVAEACLAISLLTSVFRKGGVFF